MAVPLPPAVALPPPPPPAMALPPPPPPTMALPWPPANSRSSRHRPRWTGTPGRPLARFPSPPRGTHAGTPSGEPQRVPSCVGPQTPSRPPLPLQSSRTRRHCPRSAGSLSRACPGRRAAPADNTPSVPALLPAEEPLFLCFLCCQMTLSPAIAPPPDVSAGSGQPSRNHWVQGAAARRFRSLRRRGTPHCHVPHLPPWGLAPGPFSSRGGMPQVRVVPQFSR